MSDSALDRSPELSREGVAHTRPRRKRIRPDPNVLVIDDADDDEDYGAPRKKKKKRSKKAEGQEVRPGEPGKTGAKPDKSSRRNAVDDQTAVASLSTRAASLSLREQGGPSRSAGAESDDHISVSYPPRPSERTRPILIDWSLEYFMEQAQETAIPVQERLTVFAEAPVPDTWKNVGEGLGQTLEGERAIAVAAAEALAQIHSILRAAARLDLDI